MVRIRITPTLFRASAFALSLSLSLLSLVPNTSQAAGFAILEQSAEGIGYAYAGSVTGYGDGSEIAFNPAAMSYVSGSLLSHSSQLIIPSSKFTNNGSSNVALGGVPIGGGNGPDGGETAYVPSLYFIHELNDTTHVGFGLHSPFGLSTKYDSTWVGRYHAIKSELTTIQLTPAVSYKVCDNISFGASLNIDYVDAELSNAIDLGTVAFSQLGPATASALGLGPQMNDGIGKVTGDDWGVGFTLGATYAYDDMNSRIGLAWRTRTTANLTGDADFTVPSAALPLTATGLFTDTSARAHVSLPESITGGFIHHFDEQWSILGEMQWTRWSRFEDLRIQYGSIQPDTVVNEGWDNVWRYSLAAAYQATNEVQLSAGFTFDEEPISDSAHRTPRIPGNDRKWMAFGLNWDVTEDLTLKATYAHLFISDSQSNVTDATGNNLMGTFDGNVNLVGLGFDYNLG